jgi:hypothetical protein
MGEDVIDLSRYRLRGKDEQIRMQLIILYVSCGFLSLFKTHA